MEIGGDKISALPITNTKVFNLALFNNMSATAKIRVKLKGYDAVVLDKAAKSIIETAISTGAKVSGPIPLPTKKLKVTTRKSPCGDGKASWERYEMRIHKRLIDLGVDERALRLVMRVPIPEGLNIEIELLE